MTHTSFVELHRSPLRIVASLIVTVACIALGLLNANAAPESTNAAIAGRWSADKAWTWYHAHPWLVGCNFVPSTAVNDVEMWQKETFDPQTIDRELGWAHQLGFNTVRVFVNYVTWEAGAESLKERMRQFLTIADRYKISTLVILFDDCFLPEPRAGRQDDPTPGVHNSQWVQSPGVRRRDDKTYWPVLEKYVKDLVGTLGRDKRVLAWELYNEPQHSLPLVEASFRWARKANPTQPITTTVFGNAEMSLRIIELSDVISFHHYGPISQLSAEVAKLQDSGRPLLCTEYMARTAGSRFETHLPFFKDQGIACWNWGFVAGRTQTFYPWGSPKDAPEPKVWFHDILHDDGTPFSDREARFIKGMTGALPPMVIPKPQVLAATAEASPVAWRYTLEKPAEDWFTAGFDDSAWKQGQAPFGRDELPIARKPNTIWTNADIWLRRTFEMPGGQFTELALRMQHDEDTEVFINGVLAVKTDGYNAIYEAFELSPEASAALKPGINKLAVHCRQTIGGQFIDAGIEGQVKR